MFSSEKKFTGKKLEQKGYILNKAVILMIIFLKRFNKYFIIIH